MALNKNSTGWVFLFSTIVCVVCSLCLAFANESLRPLQQANKKNDLYFNILKVFGETVFIGKNKDEKIPAETVKSLYEAHVSEILLDREGNVLKEANKETTFADFDPKMKTDKLFLSVFMHYKSAEDKKNNIVNKYAFPISGKGLWSTLHGFIAINKDLNTLNGITFYEHKETPGLGGEIEKEYFQKNFNDPENPKYMMADAGKSTSVGEFEVLKGKVDDRYQKGQPKRNYAVDGISGATLTCKGITSFLQEDFNIYNKAFFASERLKKNKGVK